MRNYLLGVGLLLMVACGGSGGGSNSSVDIRDCDVDNAGNPVVVPAGGEEEGTDEKELTVICGDGQVGDNSDNDVNEPQE